MEYLETRNFREPLLLRLKRRRPGADRCRSSWCPTATSEKLLLSRDITRWERMETTRRDFVANVSHELRTPLTVLGGFLETLSDMREPDPRCCERSLQLMTEQATRMQRLVEDLLTLSGWRARRIRCAKSSSTCRRLVRGAGSRCAGNERGQAPVHPARR